MYDSYHIPGTVNNISLYLHYLADHTQSNNTFFLTIGNTTVYTDNYTTTEQTILLDDSQLSSMLNYSLLSNTTVPVRLGFENLSYEVEYTGVADVIVITDVSGSMDWRFDTDTSGIARSCSDPNLSDPSTKRISVAKCLDKQFAIDILNISGNQLGLVSYRASTDDIEPLTTDLTTINNAVDSYYASGGTCICCGINSAKNELSNDLQRTVLIASGAEWNYTNKSLTGNIPPSNGNEWYEATYDAEVNWSTGNAVLGFDAGAGGITTDLGSIGSGLLLYADFAEPNDGDELTPQIEFTNDYISTSNTYGLGAGDDGWDWPGDYGEGSSSATDYNGVQNGKLEFDWANGPWWSRDNDCSGHDCDGGYAISVTLNQSYIDLLNANGTAQLSFDYEWDGNSGPFEDTDNIWIKARWDSPTSGQHYLGSELNNEGGDTTIEVAEGDNPNIDFSGTHLQDISSWIENNGTYYLELGALLSASEDREYGDVRFDNILLQVSNTTAHYYFRKHFHIDNLSQVRRAVLNVKADENAEIYINGGYVGEVVGGEGKEWDLTGLTVSNNFFKLGSNVIAVKLTNSVTDAAFDIELVGINDSRTGALMVMTDGVATYTCSGYYPDLDGDGSDDQPTDHAIGAACDASEEYGIKSYAVGFSDNADETTLREIAACGNGKFIKSDNVTALGKFYQDTAIEIAEVSRQSQTIVVGSGDPSDSILYSDSYININYTPYAEVPKPDEISITFQSEKLNDCTGEIEIFDGLRVADAVVTSYSGPHWTSYVAVNNQTVFNLSEYSDTFVLIGDPYTVQIPSTLLQPGNHSITILTADGPKNTSGVCSNDNSLIYTALVTASTPRTDVVEFSDGCLWTIEFEDGTNVTEGIPGDYTGSNTCSYTSTSINYNSLDAYDVAAYEILSQLDFDDDGRLFINIDTEDLEIIVTLVSEVPYLWGPAVIQSEVWS